MLWAGILFIWELVGIDLEKAKEAGGNIGAIIGAIKSPQAVPWALLILVGYFVFKVTVEWFQCHPSRRIRRVARVDFISACVVSIIAVALYVAQTLSHIQLADRLQPVKTITVILNATALFAMVRSFFWLRGWWLRGRHWGDESHLLESALTAFAIIGLVASVIQLIWGLPWIPVVGLAVIGVVLFFCAAYSFVLG